MSQELAGAGAKAKADKEAAETTDFAWPIWHSIKDVVLEPKPFDWEEERLKRRRESVKWLTGQRKREALEAQELPSKNRRSGILAFNIIQCQGSVDRSLAVGMTRSRIVSRSVSDLEFRAVAGDFARSSRPQAGGRPALAEYHDKPEGEEDEAPISSYVEVRHHSSLVRLSRPTLIIACFPCKGHAQRPSRLSHAHQKAVQLAIRQRELRAIHRWSSSFTQPQKAQLTMMIAQRDWTVEQITFVVREQRERERDPVLGQCLPVVFLGSPGR